MSHFKEPLMKRISQINLEGRNDSFFFDRSSSQIVSERGEIISLSHEDFHLVEIRSKETLSKFLGIDPTVSANDTEYLN